MKHLFAVLLSITFCCTAFSHPAFDSVNQIATEMAKQKVYESTIVGFAATPSVQNVRLNKLIQIASDKELYALAKHKNAVVRLYALRAIISKKLMVSPELKADYLNDKSVVVTLNGCIGNKSSVNVISKMIFADMTAK